MDYEIERLLARLEPDEFDMERWAEEDEKEGSEEIEEQVEKQTGI